MASAASLSPQQAASYTGIIDRLLAVADLNTISVKQIRDGLQRQVSHDIEPQKKAIKQLIKERFDKFHAEQESKAASAIETVERDPEPVAADTPAKANGHVVKAEVKEEREGDDGQEGGEDGEGEEDGFDVEETVDEQTSISTAASPVKRRSLTDDSPSKSSPPPPKKKRKNDEVDADAALAARLQAEENARSRPTRGGARKAAPVVKKKQLKKKSKDKVSAEDDSDVDGSRPEKKVNRNTGFHKLLTLSPALSELLGHEAQLSRPQATKRLWAYIKGNELQDPSDKRTICCDAPMKAVFKTDRINMFAMTKLMSQNMYDASE